MYSSLSTKFLDIDLKITDIYYHPKEVLVKFQGIYNTECEFDYHILQSEIQWVSKVKDSVGVGEFCLVEDSEHGEWYRGRVVQKKSYMYEVFLIDSGKILTVHETDIASAFDELFQLPPKIVCGIFANILPVDEKWNPKALNYFSSLRDLQIKGQVQAILPHQTFLLDVPKITSDVIELKLAKLVDGDTFRLIVEMLTEFPQVTLCKQMPDLLQQKYTRPDTVCFSAGIQPDVQLVLNSFQPLLSVGAMEQVKISVAVSPGKFYCQLLRHQTELDKLTIGMCSYYENIGKENVPSCDNLGVLCAARRKNGQWYRGVIQQLFSDNKVKIWFMDFGDYEAVPSRCVLKLQPQFISVPRFSFPCALSCLTDQDEAVRNNQLKEFKKALLRQNALYAQIDLFNSDEHLYYITLRKQQLTMKNEYQPPGNNVVPKCYSSFNTEFSHVNGDTKISSVRPVFPGCVQRKILQSIQHSDQKDSDLMCFSLTVPCKRAEMKIDSVCVAFVVYVLNPSNFWVQTNDYFDEFEVLMKRISDTYDANEAEYKMLEKPEPGKLCCARYSEDMHFYRAVIREVVGSSIKVWFLDFGNTEIVPFFDVKVLLPEFQKLPALAICCSLANAVSTEDVWTKKETDFFKSLVFGKQLTLHPIVEQNGEYIVNVQSMTGSKQDDILMLMVQAGCAEYWELKQDPFFKIVYGSQVCCSKQKNKNTHSKSHIWENKVVIANNATHSKKKMSTYPLTKNPTLTFPRWESILSSRCRKVSKEIDSPYKEYKFKPGSVSDVICCHINSPGDFACQIQNKLQELNKLMKEMQAYYNCQTMPYEDGQCACVVKHSKDGKWYRAAVLKRVSKKKVDVAFVDYGNQERVLLKHLQAIHPDFLILECQAFRCCLNSLTESLIFDPYNWTAEACSDFELFISSSNGLLTCTISALIHKSPSYLYHVVNLQTPFISAHQFLLERGHAQFWSFEFTRSLIPSLSLYSFYYSSFNMKIGCGEMVYVSCIYSPKEFYCQLKRNMDDTDKLLERITEIVQMKNHADQISTHSVYLAKYFEDGLYYRALASPERSSDYWPVYFVDFGNKELVSKTELIPIPDHASELIFTPMQAVRCYLSDLKDTEIPTEINTWFEKNYLCKELKVVIVSKESDGQLGVELYDGDLQINKKIKKLLKHTASGVEPKDRCSAKSRSQNLVPKIKPSIDKTKVKSEVVEQQRKAANKVKPCSQSRGKLRAEHEKDKADFQKQCSRLVKLPTALDNSELIWQNSKEEVLADDTNKLHVLKQNPSGQGRIRQKYPNLPQHNIQPNSKILGYISSITSLSNFYIHCAEDENKIVQLAEELNRDTLVIEPETGVELEEGDMVLAEYEIDCCIYRAVVRKVTSQQLFEVEFIDYGNTSTVHASKLHKMEEVFLNLPRFSIHCFLSKTKCVFPDKNWSSDIAAYFDSKVNKEPLIFEFLQQHGSQWEVNIFCHGLSVINELMEKEISLGLHNMLVLDFDQIAKQLPVTDADTDGNNQNPKLESQNVYEAAKARAAWESLPRISCQKVKPGQLEIAEIVHISKDGSFYVKLNKDTEILLNLNEMAAQEAEKSAFLTVENIKEGLECLAKSKETLKWYRSEVIQTYVNEHCMLVLLIDLGKYETVSFHDAKMLSDKMRSIPRNAVHCKWTWLGNLHNQSFESVVEKIECYELKILFLRYLEAVSIWEVDILVDGILLLEYLSQIPYQRKLESCNVPENINVDKRKSFVPNSISWLPFQNDRCYPGFATSVTDPSSFCIQLEDSFKTLKTLSKLLSDLPENLPTLPRELVIPGAGCLIKTGSNGRWNRVEVSEVSNCLTLIFVDDDGLSIPIPISEIHKLKIIPERLSSLPRLTYCCSLFGVSPADGQHWNDEAKLKIQEFLARPGLSFQFKPYHCGLKLEVDVLCEQNNAADVLVASGCAVYSKRAVSLGSNNSAEFSLFNSQISCNLFQMCGQKNSSATISLLTGLKEGPQKTKLQFKYVSNRNLKWSSLKRQTTKTKGGQKVLLNSNEKNENQLNDKLSNQQCDRELNQAHSSGTESEATHTPQIWREPSI
ncbi:tudor domain-containing protein 15 [Varanus komodoensis]|uniref:tudor domain-containing protein 15 n=1 Tax=Varanus komodoensis TaxID=61221 RepID=UPI001CF771F0|nr:tudor domain-containing protein 15 [Varanus komodoensis]